MLVVSQNHLMTNLVSFGLSLSREIITCQLICDLTSCVCFDQTREIIVRVLLIYFVSGLVFGIPEDRKLLD